MAKVPTRYQGGYSYFNQIRASVIKSSLLLLFVVLAISINTGKSILVQKHYGKTRSRRVSRCT